MARKILIFLVPGLFILGAAGSSFAMMCGSHSEHQQVSQSHTEHQHEQSTDIRTPTITTETVNVGNKVCPVSGEKIDEKLKATYEYKGKIYNFCCTSCIEEFKKNPEKYIKKIEEEKQKGATEEKTEETSEMSEHEEHMYH